MEYDRGLKSKVIVITGGCGDIGSTLARKLAESGANVILFDLLKEKVGLALCRKLGAQDYKAVDQGDSRALHFAIGSVAKRFGRLDCVIGNAATGAGGDLMDVTAADWEAALRVNLVGCAMLAQAAVGIMTRQTPDAEGIRGKVLFTSSWVGENPSPGAIQYCVSKAGLNHLVRLIGQQFAAEGIRVNAVAPGILDAGLTRKAFKRTPGLRGRLRGLIPVGEFETADQVADAFLYLCSKESNYMTGHILLVDGGCALSRGVRRSAAKGRKS